MPKSFFLRDFLHSARTVRNSGGATPERSFYAALSVLLNGIGDALKPKVSVVMEMKNQGAGNPDGGLYTQEQFDRKTLKLKDAESPNRGVIEVKSPAEAVGDISKTTQIDKYWDRYRLVLVTNLRDWQLIGERDGDRVTLERFELAASESEFWALAEHPDAAQKKLGDAFEDFLSRVLLHKADIADPKDLAALLASYAREARHRVERASEVNPVAARQLDALKSSLESALGVNFEAEEGGHFFRSTLVQTLFYGLFSAWVLRHEQGKPDKFDWQKAAYDLNVPMIAALFGQLSQPAKLKALNLTEVLDWATDALNRVLPDVFFKRFEAGRSIQYFYEPFLAAFDPQLRKSLGVWYTPEEIVRYQVARVDDVLKTELGLPDGLADKNVVVLDPCCGTGAYLVEVLRLIGDRLKSEGGAATFAHRLKDAVTTRLFGFELLPAPYVVAHLQLGLLLRKLGAPLSETERAGVYLTNALTGWTPRKDPKTTPFPFPEIEEERDAADAVKRTQKILVIIGNPPYDGFASVAMGEERDLSDAYRKSKRAPQPQGQGLNELYVRFFRMAERQICEHTGSGVVSFISNYSWLEGLSHTAMREQFLSVFDTLRIDNLNGDKYATGKLTPDGESDPSAFSTAQNREGIQVGTAIATLTRHGGHKPDALGAVTLRQWWGRDKLAALAASISVLPSNEKYVRLKPHPALRLAFFDGCVADGYVEWPTLVELFPVSFPGVKTSRDSALVDIDEAALVARMRRYFDATVSDAEISRAAPALMEPTARFDATKTRAGLVAKGYASGKLLRYCYRPMDVRWLYWHGETKLLDEKRTDYVPQVFIGNIFVEVRQRQVQEHFDRGSPISVLGDNWGNGLSSYVPCSVRNADLPDDPNAVQFNLSSAAKEYLDSIRGLDHADDLFFHAIAVMHSTAYRAENEGGLRQDWPRIPLPASVEALRVSAALGREVAALLDTESPVIGVDKGPIRAELKAIAELCSTRGERLSADEFAVTAGWGGGGKDGVTMPGRGKTVQRVADANEASEDAAGKPPPMTMDVYLNATAYWKNVPLPVWNFTIGGYQVMKKWLSYREEKLLGRALTLDELDYITAMARRLAALVLLQPKLDENYRAVTADGYAWPRVGAVGVVG